MAADPVTDDDEQYDSANDSDFAPAGEPNIVSSDEEDNDGDEGRKRKKPSKVAANHAAATDDDVVYENSGDEAIISRGKKKLKKAKDAEDEGGDGGLIKTRAQRAAEKEERRYAANTDPVTIDVDAIWKQMLSGQPIVQEETNESESKDTKTVDIAQETAKQLDPSDAITIKRTYNFAGKMHAEEKTVARDSAEAKLYLASEEGQAAASDASPPKRATRKAFRSAFEPIVATADAGSGRRADLNLGIAARAQAAREFQAKKLTTVEKSRMDWAGYVDKEGIQDELALAGRSKHSYAARQDFLARSQAIRDEDSRRARMAGRT
ncbi:SWR1-complex protein 5 [Cordyceps fumosorosea ARSEF 2679]|uniref:SWR1-complex protein 5 n=1 Tax=Cordyceps fumosorosea (strain ARSEF 2679) TaxID=1081104 RepID=A0A167ZEE0_CORFA|nr:SWR1-complex protein 5 [Cordyceps fumosorosea ARSEF 2679]OAA67411.1 SWR1-complex protein 5 [Cordyceps fumosorosea ARSEF 2679]